MTQRQQVANALSKTNDSRHNQSQRTNQSSPSNHRHQPKAISAAPTTATQFDSIYPLDNSKDGTAAQSLTSTTRTPSGRSKEDRSQNNPFSASFYVLCPPRCSPFSQNVRIYAHLHLCQTSLFTNTIMYANGRKQRKRACCISPHEVYPLPGRLGSSVTRTGSLS